MSGVAANGACGMDVEGVVDMEGKTEFEPDCIADQSCSASESSVDGMVETVFAVAVVTCSTAVGLGAAGAGSLADCTPASCLSAQL